VELEKRFDLQAALAGARPPASRKQVNRLVERFVGARADPQVVVLEGFHPIKHALRFGGELEVVAAELGGELGELLESHAPDLAQAVLAKTVWLQRRDFARMGAYLPHTGVVGIARRPRYLLAELLERRQAPVIVLEDPRHRGNLGAVVRVAAAAGAAGVVTVGGVDPWHPTTVRGAVGLHFALPVVAADLEQLLASGRPLLALDPEGEPVRPRLLPRDGLYLFGSERHGLSDRARAVADRRLALPMRPGVSSLNLATTAAALLYLLQLCGEGDGEAGEKLERR